MIIITNLILFVRAYCTRGQYQRLPLLHIFCLSFCLSPCHFHDFQCNLNCASSCFVRSPPLQVSIEERSLFFFHVCLLKKTRLDHFHRFFYFGSHVFFIIQVVQICITDGFWPRDILTLYDSISKLISHCYYRFRFLWNWILIIININDITTINLYIFLWLRFRHFNITMRFQLHC